MQVRIDSMAWLPKDEIKEVDLILWKRKLTLIPKKTSEYSDPSPIELFVETEFEFGMPRMFYRSIKKDDWTDVDKTSIGSPISEVVSQFKLRPYQVEPTEKMIAYLKEKLCGCFEAETGWGKSLHGLYVARELGRKTLIIVHKDTLAQQWRDRILGNPTEDDPVLRKGFLPEAKVGVVGGGKVQYVGCDFVIGTVQTLCSKELPGDFFECFGLVICDECHRLGADKWSQAVPRLKAKYRLGLSATIRRKDDAENAFFYHLGPIVERGSKAVMSPVIYCLETGFQLIETPSFNPDNIDRNGMQSALGDSDYRNNLIVDELLKALKVGRKVLCVSERIEHLKKMMKLLKWKMKEQNVYYTIGEFFKGDRKVTKEELDEAKKQDILFGSYKLIEDGEDCADLDCLVMASPVSDPIQIVGRILRTKEGKRQPIVVDVRDEQISRCKYLANSRDRWYARKDWKVNVIKRI